MEYDKSVRNIPVDCIPVFDNQTKQQKMYHVVMSLLMLISVMPVHLYKQIFKNKA